MGTKGKVQVELNPKEEEVDEGRKFFSALNLLSSPFPRDGVIFLSKIQSCAKYSLFSLFNGIRNGNSVIIVTFKREISKISKKK